MLFTQSTAEQSQPKFVLHEPKLQQDYSYPGFLYQSLPFRNPLGVSLLEILRLSTSRFCNGLRQLRTLGFSGFRGIYHLLLLLNLLLWSLLPKIVQPSGRRNHLSYGQALSHPDETRPFWPGEPPLRVPHARLILAHDTSPFPTDG